VSYLEQLSGELATVGITGARRRRILAEVDDHLRTSGDVGAFGPPALVAQRFADELATVRSRRVAYGTFVALVPAGLAFAALFLLGGPGPDITSARTVPIGVAAAATMLLAPQVAFAAALLAVIRAWALRGSAAAPSAELAVVRRRALLAGVSAGLTLTAMLVYAYEYSAGLSQAWILAIALSSAVALVPVALAVSAATQVGRLRPAVPGDGGDLTLDLAPLIGRLPFVATPWRLCFGFAACVSLLALIGGGVDEGPRNAIAEFVAIVGCFAVLGRPLGLRR
jgi:hypothetical protein